MLLFRRCFPLLLIGLLTVASGIAAERLSSGNRETLKAAGQRLAEVPEHFGDWELQSTQSLSDQEVELLQCVANTHRLYRHRKTGQTVRMFMIVGPPGPTSVHSPEICYSGQGFAASQPAQRMVFAADGRLEHAFWKVTLSSTGPTAEPLDVAYAWSSGEGWLACDYPRFSFAGKPLLYKLQLATSNTADSGASDDACRRFLHDFLPILDATLFRASAN